MKSTRYWVAAIAALVVVVFGLSVALAFTLGRQSSTPTPPLTAPTPTPTPSKSTDAPLFDQVSRDRRDEVANLSSAASYEACGLTQPTSPAILNPNDPALSNGCYWGFTSAVGSSIGGAIEGYWVKGSPWTPEEVRNARDLQWNLLSAPGPLKVNVNRTAFNRGFALGIAWTNEQWAQEPWPRPRA